MTNFETITKTGANPGRTFSIIAGIHGDEPCGIRAFEELLPSLEIETGTVHFIYGNPEAIARNVRQTEINLNRAFRPEDTLTESEKGSYERKRALEIMKYLDESDAMLDIHSSGTKGSMPFIICEPHSFPVAEKLPFALRSYGWDNIHSGSTDYYMNKAQKMGVCVECGYHDDVSAVEKAKESIVAFLRIFGAISGDMPASATNAPANLPPQKTIKAKSTYRTKADFSPTEDFADFQKITRGQVVGFDGEHKVIFDADGYIIFCRKRDSAFEEAFVVGGDF
jgi:succinylglutamate desuccinylase